MNEEIKLRADIAARLFDSMINNKNGWKSQDLLKDSIDHANQIVDDAIKQSELKSQQKEID